MSEDQRKEFEQYRRLGGELGRAWIKAHFPQHSDNVDTEFERLCVSIRTVAAEILSDEGIEEPSA
jgi:hypothetical protein